MPGGAWQAFVEQSVFGTGTCHIWCSVFIGFSSFRICGASQLYFKLGRQAGIVCTFVPSVVLHNPTLVQLSM